jgi:glycosyltransferase involved in cell wall biosynthesis
MKPPRISIVTPSFNQGEFLEECIDSILSQNYPDLEYIIMDGGSTDNSVEIIRKYEKYLTYWQSKPDKGQYDAINEGFKKTSGEIMAWLNSDDKYHHHAFFKVSHIFIKHRDVEWLIGRPSEWDSEGNMLRIEPKPLPVYSREKYLRKDYKSPSIQQESTFWRRSLWEKAGSLISADLDYAGDLELWIRFFRYAPLHVVDTLLGGYRKHGNQKVALYMDRYIREASELLNAETRLFRQGQYKEVFPAPSPLSISPAELKYYIDELFRDSRHEVYALSDDSERVITFVLKDLDAYSNLSNEEAVIKSALVVIFKKLHIYDFYVSHEPTFSKIYHFFRRFLFLK